MRRIPGVSSLVVCLSVVMSVGCASAPEKVATPQAPCVAAASTRPPGALTSGVDHVGLAVRDLAITQAFFVEAMGFKVLGEDANYPSAFLTDGVTIVTLWQVLEPSSAVAFSRRQNIGLHHLAFRLDSLDELDAMYDRVKEWPGVEIEFAPELLNGGPSKHMMFTEPGGVRLEFIVRVKSL